WEDTARFDNSAVGPNISDMTIQVQHKIASSDEFELSCMPVIRYPNFSDLSGDISPDEFFLLATCDWTPMLGKGFPDTNRY
ncbi:MAG: hypothetical protein IH991_17495, partial [Planctomycetes bacterium]|nr:hypothetical protein [Planctomycetota bacterium]